MRDEDLKNFFNEDAYNELLNTYAEEDERKAQRSILADVHRKTDAPNKGDVPARPSAPHQRQIRNTSPAPKIPAPDKKQVRYTSAHETAASHTPTRSAPSAKEPQISVSPIAGRTAHAPNAADGLHAQNTARPQNNAHLHTPAAAEPRHPYAEPIRPMTPAAPPARTSNFKVEIQGLDEEFNQAPERRPRRTAGTRPNATPAATPNAKKQNAGAFSDFSEIIQKRRSPKNPAEGNFMVTDMPSDASHAQIVKQRPEKFGWDTVKAFFLKNKETWIVIAICVAAAILFSTYTISCMNDILAVNRDSETVVTVNIPAEANTKTVLKILQQNDLIEHRHFCSVFAKIMGFKEDNYLTGVYYVTASMGVEKMLSTFKVASVTGETVTLTFPEGYTVDQIVQKLEKYEVCSAAVLYQTMREVDFSSEFSFIASMDNKEARYRMLEGYMYPDTYEFYIGESPSSVLRKFLNNFNKKWTDEYAAQAEKLGMSVDDVITLASIIQKEAYGADQSPLVSSVLHNRLNKSGLYPSLQCDSTEEYINEYIKANTKDAVQVGKYTDLYSSYKCVGLPVGAICNPGDDAIKAALYPEKTDYYFFAHDVNKKLYLARNDNERRSNNLAILNANSEAEKNKSNR